MEPKKKVDDYGQQIRDLGQVLPAISSGVSKISSFDDTTTAAKPMSDAQGQKYDGLCQAFVESVLGSGWKGSSAIDAWKNQQDRAVASLNGVKPGEPIYFAPDASNKGYGHTGIYSGNGKFISATDNGIKELPVDSWIKDTGQQVLGYLQTKK